MCCLSTQSKEDDSGDVVITEVSFAVHQLELFYFLVKLSSHGSYFLGRC